MVDIIISTFSIFSSEPDYNSKPLAVRFGMEHMYDYVDGELVYNNNASNSYWDIVDNSNVDCHEFSYIKNKKEAFQIVDTYSTIETFYFADITKDLSINLVHHHDNVHDIVQTLNVDYAHKDDVYKIISDPENGYKIIKK
jgi:hypothetical protein